MLNKLADMLRSYDMVQPGDTVICAVSGGADSVALLFALYLLKDKWGFQLEAAHFNHQLRDSESDRDERFVRELCERYDITLHLGTQAVTAGDKGLEAAAREARYSFFATLSGKIATAHTADDNAETVLMHLVRGTGLRGLGGIAPVRGNIIRPMLSVTRQDVLAFLDEYFLSYVCDSSNDTDRFLRNRIRHHVMPLLKQENPRLAENLSQMALRLREDATALENLHRDELPDVDTLREMEPAVRRTQLARFLRSCGVREPESAHILQAEKLVFSQRPSAYAQFPGNVCIAREYGKLVRLEEIPQQETVELPCPGEILLPHLGIRVVCSRAEGQLLTTDGFTVDPVGKMVIRRRLPGDRMRLQGGAKDLKKIMVDRKIPAHNRGTLPVIADEQSVLGVYSVGANLDRTGTNVLIRFEAL